MISEEDRKKLAETINRRARRQASEVRVLGQKYRESQFTYRDVLREKDEQARMRELAAEAQEHVKRCHMLQPGCKRFYLTFRAGKRPTCGNKRCQWRLRYLDRLCRDGRMTTDEYKLELAEYESAFGVNPWPLKERVEIFQVRVARCEIAAKGCKTWAYRWNIRKNWEPPLACGSLRCRSRAFRKRLRRAAG